MIFMEKMCLKIVFIEEGKQFNLFFLEIALALVVYFFFLFSLLIDLTSSTNNNYFYFHKLLQFFLSH